MSGEAELPSFNPGTEFVRPPWTADQVASLNGYQQAGVMHEFTCGNSDCRRVDGKPLTAAEDGWHCLRCGYTQEFAHAWMADWSWQQGLPLRNLAGFADGGHGGPGTGYGLRDVPLGTEPKPAVP